MHIYCTKDKIKRCIYMETIIYCRKSRGTEEELQNQIDICESYCRSKEYEVSEIFSEVRSSQDFSREYYCKMMEYIKAHGDIRVVCTDLSRLNRNVVAQIKLNDLLIKHNSIIETVNNGVVKLDTPENKMLNNIIANFDEFYYNVTKQKMQRGLIEARKKGIRIGSKPYGYEIENKRLVIDPQKADIVKRVYKLIAEGYSTKQVVEALKTVGVTTNTGRSFDTRAIRLMVQNEGYTGVNKVGDLYPPIIDKELFLLANQQLKSVPNKGSKRSYALSGKIFCSHCNNTMILGFKKDRGLVIVSKGMNKTCKCSSIRLSYIENMVLSDTSAYLENRLYSMYDQLKSNNSILASHKHDIEAIEKEIEANSKKLDKLKDMYLMDIIDKEELQSQSNEIKDNIARLTLKRERISNYSLYEKVAQLQNKVVEIEEYLHNPSIESAVKYVDKVLYWRSDKNIEVNVKFKEGI